MNDRKTFTQTLADADTDQLTLPLPPVPRIKAHTCRYCHTVHLSAADFVQCREANT